MIQFDNVTRRYGAKTAVSELNLEIRAGELFAFLGPNGTGKTTTIKMVVGLLRPSSGTIRLCGHDVAENNSAANRLLGYVPDVPYLYDKLTGSEFLQFIADMYGLDARETTRKIAQQIELFELHEFVEDLTESYSHGMKQRLAFAAAMLHNPRCWSSTSRWSASTRAASAWSRICCGPTPPRVKRFSCPRTCCRSPRRLPIA